MLRTIAVSTGAHECAQAAQEHALEVAQRFDARLRVVGIWDGAEQRQPAAVEPPEELARRQIDRLIGQAREHQVTVEERRHGEGLVDSLLNEAMENDLLVVGLPARDDASGHPLVERLLGDDMPVIRKAEAPVLVVSQPPQPTRTVLVNYQGQREGKDALRLAGNWAERLQAAVVVLSVEGDPARSSRMAEIAKRYLAGFDLPSVETMEEQGDPMSEVTIQQAAERADADLIAMGAEPYGLLDRFLDRDRAQDLARTTELPLLVAR